MQRPLKNSKLLMENVLSGLHRLKELPMLCSYTRNCDGKLVCSYSQKFCDELDSSGMLIQHSGILLALSLSCDYNLEVCAVEPPCTRVEAKTGDKALTSWWVVKLGRYQLWQMTYKFVWFLWLLRLLFSFGYYVTLVAVVSMCSYDEIWSMCSYCVICSWNM